MGLLHLGASTSQQAAHAAIPAVHLLMVRLPALPACAGIYGPGEQRHLPRVVAATEAGLFRFVYGSPDALVDFVHVSGRPPFLLTTGRGLWQPHPHRLSELAGALHSWRAVPRRAGPQRAIDREPDAPLAPLLSAAPAPQVDNLVAAHALAAKALGPERQHVAAGQAYFISDDAPVNNFEFFRPLVRAANGGRSAASARALGTSAFKRSAVKASRPHARPLCCSPGSSRRQAP